MSGNTFGAAYWTDGKMDAPMLPDQPWLVKCPHCGALLWIDKLEVVEKTWAGDDDREGDECRRYQLPNLQDYFTKLRKPRFGKEKERYLRVRAWWAGNDQRRRVEGEKSPPQRRNGFYGDIFLGSIPLPPLKYDVYLVHRNQTDQLNPKGDRHIHLATKLLRRYKS